MVKVQDLIRRLADDLEGLSFWQRVKALLTFARVVVATGLLNLFMTVKNGWDE